MLGNIGDPAAVAEMNRSIAAELGPVDILVNCAGGDIGAAGGKPNPNNALDIALEDIQTEINNNLIGTMLVTPGLRAADAGPGSGSVVNIASAAAHMGGTQRGRLLHAQGGGRALHALPRGGAAAVRRADQRGQPRPDEDRALPGDAGRPIRR